METYGPTPEKEIKEMFKLSRSQMEARRANTDEDIDWWRNETERGRIYWSKEQVEAMHEEFAEKSGATDATPSDDRGIGKTPERVPTRGGIELYVVGLARNPRFVHVDLEGVKTPVRINRGKSFKLLGKKIEVIKDEKGELQYTGQ